MDLRISSPCPKSWDDLRGDDRVRYCDDCKLNVYNLAEMSRPEIEALVRRSSGRVCGRLFLRGDRTATLRSCPKGDAAALLRKGAVLAGALALAAFAWLFRGIDGPDRSRLPSWVRAVVEMIDPAPYSRCEVVGALAPPPPPPVRNGG